VVLIQKRFRGTDRQTDGRHAISIPRFVLIVHRAVIMTAALTRYCEETFQSLDYVWNIFVVVMQYASFFCSASLFSHGVGMVIGYFAVSQY